MTRSVRGLTGPPAMPRQVFEADTIHRAATGHRAQAAGSILAHQPGQERHHV